MNLNLTKVLRTAVLLRCQSNVEVRFMSTSSVQNGRYGHRLIKLWEQKDYTTKPLKVWRTGGRLPEGPDRLPGKKWTAKLGGGLDRQFFWVQHNRLTAEDIANERFFCERVVEVKPDDNRSGHIALVAGPLLRRWILATEGMKVGDIIKNCAKPQSGIFSGKDGDAFPLKLMPIGTRVCSVEFIPGMGGRLARSAGNFCTVLRKSESNIVLQLPSGREVSVRPDCVAVIGRISNLEHDDEIWGSSQQSFDYGIRPGSGKWNRKDGRHGRKIYPKKPMIVYEEAEFIKAKKSLED